MNKKNLLSTLYMPGNLVGIRYMLKILSILLGFKHENKSLRYVLMSVILERSNE